MQIDGETMEMVTDFICLGFKISAVGDCSLEIIPSGCEGKLGVALEQGCRQPSSEASQEFCNAKGGTGSRQIPGLESWAKGVDLSSAQPRRPPSVSLMERGLARQVTNKRPCPRWDQGLGVPVPAAHGTRQTLTFCAHPAPSAWTGARNQAQLGLWAGARSSTEAGPSLQEAKWEPARRCCGPINTRVSA